MLKLAIVRVHEEDASTEVMLEVPLAEVLSEAIRSRHLPGFRGRAAKRLCSALAEVESALKGQTITLT